MLDLDQLQTEVAEMKFSNAVEELEIHLTERIAAISEQGIKINMTHRQTVDGISETVDACKKIVEESLIKQKDNYIEMRDDFEARFA